jgi:hypothetical protein
MPSKEEILAYFIASDEYKTLKAKNEKSLFKLLGDYYKFDDETMKLVKMKPSQLSEQYKNKKINLNVELNQYDKNGNKIVQEVTKNFYQVWSEDPDMKEYEDIIFECDPNKTKSSDFNLFRGFRKFPKEIRNQAKKADLKPVFEHMMSLVNDDKEHFNYLLNWLAQLVQQPHILPHTSLIFISKEGVGKDLFYKFISDSINHNYCLNTEKLEQICGKFNSSIGGKLLVGINETNPVESRERIENIKYLITADTITIEGKHKDPIKAKNFCRFMFFSNRLFAFPVEEGSRRPVLFHSSDRNLKEAIGEVANKKYFTNLYDVYDNPAYQCAFLSFLLNRDISNWNPKDFKKSALHAELEDNAVSPLVGFLGSIVTNALKTKKQKVRMSTVEALNDCLTYMKANNYRYELTQTKFNAELTQIYKVSKLKSCGSMYFDFDISDIRKMLETKYKYDFEENNEADFIDDNNDEDDNDDGKDYKALYQEQQAELKDLRLFAHQYPDLWKQFQASYLSKPQPESKIEKALSTKPTADDLKALDEILEL